MVVVDPFMKNSFISFITKHRFVVPEVVQVNEVLRVETVLCEDKALFYITNTLSWTGSKLLAVAKAEGLSKPLDVMLLTELT